MSVQPIDGSRLGDRQARRRPAHPELPVYLMLFLLLLLAQTPAAGAQTIVRAGAVLDPESGQLQRNREIVIVGDRITAVRSASRTRAGATVIDLSRYTVLPGLIDAHVHLTIGGTVRANALADLQAGFTTVVDLGSRGTRFLRIKDSINAGQIPGPRVLAAGIWIGRKNGVCEFGGIGIAGDTGAYRERVRVNSDSGANVLKACVSSWPGVVHASPDSVELDSLELRAIVDEAAKRGRRVVAHAIGRRSAQLSARTGVAGLAHTAYMDASLARELKERGVFMTTTIASLTAGDTSAVSRDLIASLMLAYRAGVEIVFGTDGGVLPHGQNAQELVALTRAGVSALDAIRSATIGAARAYGLQDSVGTIAVGRIADLIAVEGDPTRDIFALARVRCVIQRGRKVSGNC